MAAAGKAVGSAIGADQLALDAERSGLQRNKVNVLKSTAIDCLTKHDCGILALITAE
jgi:hypothetical protein